MESEIHVRLYEELNDYIAPQLRKRRFACALANIKDVKDLLAHLRIFEDEVELVLVNGESAGLDHPLSNDDDVSLYPVFESFDVKPLLRIRQHPLRQSRFLLDRGLEQLAADLRRLGFDVLETGSLPKQQLASIAESEKRLFVTTDPDFPTISRLYILRSYDPRHQITELLSRLDYDAQHGQL